MDLDFQLLKKIIEKLDGSVGVESNGNGEGSKFYFILPSIDQKSFTMGKNIPKTELSVN
jgi:light-regulated signal transduction histidine kinase (bacteriophytochrome)